MPDIELVIKIPEEIRLALINNIPLSMDQQSICDTYIKQAIINGTPLPDEALEQEPFINKPCVSSGVCEHDKNEVLDKIRAEIENDWQLKKYPSSPFSCGLRQAIGIIDKYKAESEDNNEQC